MSVKSNNMKKWLPGGISESDREEEAKKTCREVTFLGGGIMNPKEGNYEP